MSLPRDGERGLLEIIRKRFGRQAPPAPAGIGDDCSVLPAPASGRILLTTDCLIESVHFRRGEPAYFLGRKALAVNLSDVAAMGGEPSGFLLTLGRPPDLRRRDLEALIDGLVSVSREHRVELIGGDLSRSTGHLFISITVLGRAGRPARPLTRSGARAGHGIYVSGPLGGSAAGRRLLEAGWRPRLRGRSLAGIARPRAAPAGADRPSPRMALRAVRRHLDPAPRLDLGRRLRAAGIASAAIDISDGLSSDLESLAVASGVGAKLIEPAIPIDDAARACAGTGIDPIELALHGGEDYELLFTVPRTRETDLADLDAVPIGRVVPKGRGLTLVDAEGRERPMRVRGHDHFRP